MRRRYVFAPDAALDLVQIWRYIKKESSEDIADRVEAAIHAQIVLLAKSLSLPLNPKELTMTIPHKKVEAHFARRRAAPLRKAR